jgi:predicted DNA-binding protein YlxM (UPF0122 family)
MMPRRWSSDELTLIEVLLLGFSFSELADVFGVKRGAIAGAVRRWIRSID